MDAVLVVVVGSRMKGMECNRYLTWPAILQRLAAGEEARATQLPKPFNSAALGVWATKVATVTS